MYRFLYIASLLSLCAAPALAQDGAGAQSAMLDDANILWTCIAAFLVFFMQAGFAFVESGSTRAKNVSDLSV